MRTFQACMLLALCGHIATAQEQSEAPTELPPGWWLIPKTDTRLKFGGYVYGSDP